MKTFAMIKPDAVRTRCIGQVLSRIELSTSVRVIEMRMVLLDEQQARQFIFNNAGEKYEVLRLHESHREYSKI